jgi:NTE family protein
LTNDKYTLLKLHPCSRGLSDEAVLEIADAGQLVKSDADEVLHRDSEKIDHVWFVIHGRVSLTIFDANHQVISRRDHLAGSQFGALMAGLADPLPMECIVKDPATLLRFDYKQVSAFLKKHALFRINIIHSIVDSIKQSLMPRKQPVRPRIVSIFHASHQTRRLSHDLIKRIRDLGEQVCLLHDEVNWHPIDGIQVQSGMTGDQMMDDQQVRERVQEWSDFERLFFDVQTTLAYSRASHVVELSNLVLWCVTHDSWQSSLAPLRDLLKHSPSWKEKICIVWLLDDSEHAPVASELRELANEDIKVSYRAPAKNRNDLLNLGIHRLVHRVRGIKIGLALGGGAARGMAHLGVLQTLEENGIIVDMMAGTSAGAMTGVTFASGMKSAYATECFVKDLLPSWFFRTIPGGDHWYLLYKYRTGQFDPMLRRYLSDLRFEQFPIAMHAITVDLIQGRTVIRDTGDAVDAILESINLPVIAQPINRNGQSLVDGGVINNVPADVLVSKGCNFVIAVNVTAKMEHEFVGNRSNTPTNKMRRPSMLQTVMRSYVVQSSNIRDIGTSPADVMIEPDLRKFPLTAFTQAREMAVIGMNATLESMPEIKQSLHDLDADLFPREAQPASVPSSSQN